MKRRLKTNGIIIALVVLVIAFFPRLFFHEYRRLGQNTLTNCLGFLFILFGQLIRISARGYKAAHSKQGQALLSSGPYEVTRNPMYVGILLIGLGVVTVLFNFWAAVVFVAVFLLRYGLLILQEEKKLVGIFGKEYRDYQARVPRFFPSLKAMCRLGLSGALPLEHDWIRHEIGSCFAVLAATLLVKIWWDWRVEGVTQFSLELMAIACMFVFFSFFVQWLLGRKKS